MSFVTRISETDRQLSDDELLCELRCAQRCAMCSTRSRRELALIRVRCARLELERRAALTATGMTTPDSFLTAR